LDYHYQVLVHFEIEGKGFATSNKASYDAGEKILVAFKPASGYEYSGWPVAEIDSKYLGELDHDKYSDRFSLTVPEDIECYENKTIIIKVKFVESTVSIDDVPEDFDIYTETAEGDSQTQFFAKLFDNMAMDASDIYTLLWIAVIIVAILTITYGRKFACAKKAGIIDPSRGTVGASVSFMLKTFIWIITFLLMLHVWIIMIVYYISIFMFMFVALETPAPQMVILLLVLIIYSILVRKLRKHIRRKWKELTIPPTKNNYPNNFNPNYTNNGGYNGNNFNNNGNYNGNFGNYPPNKDYGNPRNYNSGGPSNNNGNWSNYPRSNPNLGTDTRNYNGNCPTNNKGNYPPSNGNGINNRNYNGGNMPNNNGNWSNWPQNNNGNWNQPTNYNRGNNPPSNYNGSNNTPSNYNGSNNPPNNYNNGGNNPPSNYNGGGY
jgi:hypothetical protein